MTMIIMIMNNNNDDGLSTGIKSFQARLKSSGMLNEAKTNDVSPNTILTPLLNTNGKY